MNKKFVLAAFFVLAAAVGFATNNDGKAKEEPMPANIKAIIEKSCFGCHNTDSKNEDAKKELDLKTFENLKTAEKVHALREIGKTLSKNEMPPEKFLARFPDKKLTDDEKKALMDWAKSTAIDLTK